MAIDRAAMETQLSHNLAIGVLLQRKAVDGMDLEHADRVRPGRLPRVDKNPEYDSRTLCSTGRFQTPLTTWILAFAHIETIEMTGTNDDLICDHSSLTAVASIDGIGDESLINASGEGDSTLRISGRTPRSESSNQ